MESQTVIKNAWESSERNPGNILKIQNLVPRGQSPMTGIHRNGLKSRPLSSGGASTAFFRREKVQKIYQNKDLMSKIRPSSRGFFGRLRKPNTTQQEDILVLSQDTGQDNYSIVQQKRPSVGAVKTSVKTQPSFLNLDDLGDGFKINDYLSMTKHTT